RVDSSQSWQESQGYSACASYRQIEYQNQNSVFLRIFIYPYDDRLNPSPNLQQEPPTMQKPLSHHYVTKRATTLIAGVLMTGLSLAAQAETLLNVSYDPTREFYSEFNRAFNLYWQQQGNEPLTI